MQRDLSPFVIAELAARESWKRRDYAAGYAEAGHAAELAQEAGDELRWWKMVLLQAECLRDQGSIQECQQLAVELAAHPVANSAPDLGARAAILLAHSLQGLGRLPEAVDAATTAARLVAGDFENVYLHIQAQQALIAALAESGRHEDAWQECLDLESLLTDHVDEDTAGKAYWVIGNVAFLSNRVNEGGHYHDLAAGKLSPSQDVDLWARFNRASAEMRLQAKLGDAATLRCIERAELATEVVGGSERDILEMSLVRAHWYYLTGDMGTAISLLTPLRSKFPILATQTAAEATFILGRALMAQGHEAESLQMLDEAATLFDTAAAPERSATVRGFIASAEPSDRRHQQFLQGGVMPEATVFPGAAPLQPEVPTRPAPAPGVACTRLHDLAVKAVLPRGADLNETATAQLYSRIGELAGNRRVAVVLELTGVRSVNRAARAAYAAIPSVSAWAILGESPVDRLLGHFLLGGEFNSVPAQYFTAENDALDWLSRLDDVL